MKRPLHTTGKGTRSRFGFSLMEVVVGSVVVATFVGGTVFMAGQIAESRIGAQEQRNRNTWANVQSQLTAEGVNSNTDSAVWADSPFVDVAGQANSDLRFSSTIADRDDINVGEMMVVKPMRLDLNSVESAVNIRTNRFNSGLRLIDHENATGASSVYDIEDATPIYLPDFALAIYDQATGQYSYTLASGGTNLTASLQAWTDINWNEENIHVYLLCRSPGRTINSVRITNQEDADVYYDMSAGAIAGLTGLSGGWQVGAAISPEDFRNNELVHYNVSASTTTAKGVTHISAPQLSLRVYKVTPEITRGRIDMAGDPVLTDTGRVTLNDVAPGILSLTEAQVAQLNPVRMHVRITGPGNTQMPDGMADLLSVVNYIGSVEVSNFQRTTVNDVIDITFFAPGTCFISTEPHQWSTAIVSDHPLVNNIDPSTGAMLTPDPTYLPQVLITPSADPVMEFDQSFDVSLSIPNESRLNLAGIDDSYFYRVYYTTNGSVVSNLSTLYTHPFRIGGTVAYGQTQVVRANSIRRYTGFNSFLLESPETVANYAKDVPGDEEVDAMWNYGPTPADPDGATYENMVWSNPTSWLPEEVPGDGLNDIPHAKVLFGSVIPEAANPDYGRIYLDINPDVGDLFFNNQDKSFIIEKSGDPANKLNLKPAAGDFAQLTVISGRDHQIKVPVTIEGNLLLNVLNSTDSIEFNSLDRKDPNQTYGVVKTGPGVIAIDSGASTGTSKVRIAVQDGSIKLRSDSPILPNQDAGGFAPIWLEGGALDLGGHSQSLRGVMQVTQSSNLFFGTTNELDEYEPGTLTLAEYTIGSGHYAGRIAVQRGILDVRNYREEAPGEPGDHFYSYYPGLASLSRIRFPEIGEQDEPTYYGRWIPDGTYTDNLLNGEIVPRQPPTSTGIAYLTVSRDSSIFFEGTCKLSTQDIDVYPGATLRIIDFQAESDLLTVELEPEKFDKFQVDDVLGSIRFYRNATLSGSYYTAKLLPYTVTRDGQSKLIYRVVPSNYNP